MTVQSTNTGLADNALKTELDSVIIRFAGDSGDGIQVTGNQFSNESALAGNDLSTLPNFPAEIRAPAGTLAGVSGFQINFGSIDIFTPGDTPDVLVAMNPAALKSNIKDLKSGGVLIVNEDAFHEKNLSHVGYAVDPTKTAELQNTYKIYNVPITKLTKEALSHTGLSSREVERCKNFFALGIMLWLFSRPSQSTIEWIKDKFAKSPDLVEANTIALKSGMTFAEATDMFTEPYVVRPAKLAPGKYKNINGTLATAYGLIAASQKSGLPLYFGAYPITPASDLLHELSKHKRLGITTFQAEDEISAVCSAIGASYTGSIGVTSSSGPGIALKTEAINLAVMTELPLVIVDVQRAGPSTGLPTKTEQSDLFQALFGRPGEAPVCVLAASNAASAFKLSYEAARIATKYMCPVFFLSDGYIANCSEPWAIPDPTTLSNFEAPIINETADEKFFPYKRNEITLARPWARPGTPELMHRIGGLEKQETTGNVSYDPDNHERMSRLRAEKIERIQNEIPPLEIDGTAQGELLLVGWGSTEGTLTQAVIEARRKGLKVSRIHLHYLNPLPRNLGDVLSRFSRILVPEINFGQLKLVLRGKYLVNAQGVNSLRGQPLRVSDVVKAIEAGAQLH